MIDVAAWEVPGVFRILQTMGTIPDHEMRSTFNMGLGFLAVVDPTAGSELPRAFARFDHTTWLVGEVLEGERGVEYS